MRQTNCGEMSYWRQGRSESNMTLGIFVDKNGSEILCLGQISPN